MRKHLLLIFLILSFVFTKGQDQLFKKDNTKLEVKVFEVSPTQIKYKLFSNPDGPLYVINKNEVALIIYKNGQHEAFKDLPVENTNTNVPDNSYEIAVAERNEAEQKKFLELTQKDNIAFCNMSEVANFAFGGSYFRELLNHYLDVQIPFAFSFGEPYAYNSRGSLYGTYYGSSNNVYNFKTVKKTADIGLGVYFNTSPDRAVTHFIGPMFRFAQFNANYQTNFYQEPDNIVPNMPYYSLPVYYVNRSCVFNETYFSINNGILFRVHPQFNIMINLNIGRLGTRDYIANDPSKYSTSGNYYNYNTKTVFQLGFNMGYRF